MAKQIDELEKDFEERLERDKKHLELRLEQVPDKKDIDPLTLPPEIWGNTYWDFMNPEERDQILAGMFRNTLARGKQVMPVYKNSDEYKNINPDHFQSMEQLRDIPLLLKDGVNGFRAKVGTDPEILKPEDIMKTLIIYFSGGTKGISTPTYISGNDVVAESLALGMRCFLPGGLDASSNFYNYYNPTHKGGRIIEEAIQYLGMQTLMTRRPEDDLEACVRKMKAYKTDAIAAVQPPLDGNESNKKGGGVSFINLYGEDIDMFGAGNLVERAFVTGFALPEEIIELSQDIGLDLFTTWGASEALPGSTSTVLGPETRMCKYNNQHLLYGPHFLSVMKMESCGLDPAQPGEDGLLLVTTVARDGTLYFNYAIGDKATVISNTCDCGRTTPIIGNIRRVDNPAELEGGGCRLC